MDYLPELADNGHNWTAYGSWVLCAIIDKGLMGFLVRSETRPTHPAQLEGCGEGWTPQTNEERDMVAAWQTADRSWTQQNATVNYMIICGILDSIFSSMLHLKSPLEKWVYLEKCFGQILRPKSWLAAEQTMRQHNTQPEQITAEEESFPDSPNDCTEILTGYLEPETDIADMQQTGCSPVVETGISDAEWPNKCMNVLEVPDEKCQHADKAMEGQDLLEWSSEAPKPADDPTSQACTCSIEFVPKSRLGQDQSLLTSGETVLDVPGPPLDARIKCPMLQDTPSVRTCSATTMELKLPCTRRYNEPRQGGQLSTQSHSPAPLTELPYWNGWLPDHDTKRIIGYNEVSDAGNAQTRGHVHHGDHTDGNPTILLSRALTKRWKPSWYIYGTYWMQGVSNRIKTSTENISDAHTRQYTKSWMKQPNGLPVSPIQPPNGLVYPPGTLRDPCRRRWIKTRPKNISKSRQRGCKHLMLLSMPISPPCHLSKYLWNVTNTYWWKGVPPGWMRNDGNLVIANACCVGPSRNISEWFCGHREQSKWPHGGCMGASRETCLIWIGDGPDGTVWHSGGHGFQYGEPDDVVSIIGRLIRVSGSGPGASSMFELLSGCSASVAPASSTGEKPSVHCTSTISISGSRWDFWLVVAVEGVLSSFTSCALLGLLQLHLVPHQIEVPILGHVLQAV
ncbi:hypothetical protein EDC04DRAFT_3090900 [Pisolithus marmoratus]|nr:hypothetical protein EDC04DRAFT_3090900 [Pisolithus marmoratus]